MKRNSKRFMALFLSLAMSITPAILIQAEEAADIKEQFRFRSGCAFRS